MSENTSEQTIVPEQESKVESPPHTNDVEKKEETKQEEPEEEEEEEPKEEMNEFELVGLSPESQKKDSTEADQNNKDEDVKINLAEELDNADKESAEDTKDDIDKDDKDETKDTPQDESQASGDEETTNNRRRRSADVRKWCCKYYCFHFQS